jgi:hypothetical protein
MNKNGYICVTGFDNPSQIDRISISKTSESIVCGVLVSKESLENNFKLRFPIFEDVIVMSKKIKSRGFKFALHYCPKSQFQDDVEKDVGYIFDKMPFDLHPDLIQINSGNEHTIGIVLRSLPSNCSSEVIFQLNNTIIHRYQSHNSAISFFQRVRQNIANPCHCLYDLSGGKGILVSDTGIEWNKKIIEHSKLYDLIKTAGFIPAISGGLNPDNVKHWIKKFGTRMSIDCGSSVRSGGNILDSDKVNAFYHNAINAKDELMLDWA